MTTTTTTSDPLLRTATREGRSSRLRRRSLIRWVKRIALGILALAVIGAIVYAWLPRPVLVDLSVVRRAALEVEVSEDGQTRVRDRFVVAAPITGELQRIEARARGHRRGGRHPRDHPALTAPAARRAQPAGGDRAGVGRGGPPAQRGDRDRAGAGSA